MVGNHSLELVGAALRLGRKYEMDDLVSDAMTRLHYLAPISLAKYDQKAKDRGNIDSPYYGTDHNWISADIVDLIVLLDEIDARYWLPYLL